MECEVLSQGRDLVERCGKVVGETAGGGEVGCAGEVGLQCRLGVANGLVIIQSGCTNVGHVWTSWEAGVVDFLVGAQTARVAVVAGEGGNTVVSGGPDESVALQTELQELVALALGVVNGSVELGYSVGHTDDPGWLVGTALIFAFVSSWCGIGVDGIDTGSVAFDTVG